MWIGFEARLWFGSWNESQPLALIVRGWSMSTSLPRRNPLSRHVQVQATLWLVSRVVSATGSFTSRIKVRRDAESGRSGRYSLSKYRLRMTSWLQEDIAYRMKSGSLAKHRLYSHGEQDWRTRCVAGGIDTRILLVFMAKWPPQRVTSIHLGSRESRVAAQVT